MDLGISDNKGTEELQQQDTEEILQQEDTEIVDLEALKDTQDTVTSPQISSQQVVQSQKGTASTFHEGTASIPQEGTGEEEEYEKRIKVKGKAPMSAEEDVQPKKIKAREAAQIDHDAELGKKIQEDEIYVASFMEAQRLQNEELAFGPTLDYQPSE